MKKTSPAVDASKLAGEIHLAGFPKKKGEI